MNVKRWLLAVTVVALTAARAMTYAEFKAAITAAQDGGTVVLENDVTYDSALPSISKRIMITSPAGATNTLLRAARSAWIARFRSCSIRKGSRVRRCFRSGLSRPKEVRSPARGASTCRSRDAEGGT